MTLGLVLHRGAAENPGKTALFDGERRMSYAELDAATSRLANWLLYRGDLCPGDRVAIHWGNSLEAAQIYFAIFKAGLIAVPIDSRSKPAEIAYVFEHSEARMCFSQPELAPFAKAARAEKSALVPMQIYTELPAQARTIQLPEIDPGQPAVLFYANGNGSRPRAVIHTHRTLQQSASMVASGLMDGEDTVLVTTSLMHFWGLNAALLPAILTGASSVLLADSDPEAILDTIERYGCTFLASFPATLQFVAEEQARRRHRVHSLRTVIAGGDSVAGGLRSRFLAVFGLPLQEIYGMAESLPITVNPKRAVRRGSIGMACPEAQVAVVDSDGNPAPLTHTGEIVVRSPANCIGYWNDREATEKLLRGRWLHTGDRAYCDANGYYWFAGRLREVIVRAGWHISPQEIQAELRRHPAVLEAAVVGEPDEIYGERVAAFVRLRDGGRTDERQLREHLRERLADYKVPETIVLVDALPKTVAGSPDRRALGKLLPDRGAPEVTPVERSWSAWGLSPKGCFAGARPIYRRGSAVARRKRSETAG